MRLLLELSDSAEEIAKVLNQSGLGVHITPTTPPPAAPESADEPTFVEPAPEVLAFRDATEERVASVLNAEQLERWRAHKTTLEDIRAVIGIMQAKFADVKEQFATKAKRMAGNIEHPDKTGDHKPTALTTDEKRAAWVAEVVWLELEDGMITEQLPF